MSTVTAEAAPVAHSPAHRRRFGWGMAGIATIALGVRVTWVLVARRNFSLHGDDFFYHWQANALADGKGFLNPFVWQAVGTLKPSAAHPPLYSLYLSVFSWFGLDTPLDHRLASCLLGVAAVVAIGFVARRIAGDLAGLLAAALAAVYPQLWINDGMLISESLYVLFIALTLLWAYRVWDSDQWVDAVVLGTMIGLSSLTRPEAVILVPLLGIPYLCARRGRAARRFGMVLVVGAACLAVILPWWVRNLTTFEDPTFLATGNGVVLKAANCDGTYSGQFLGYWDINCIIDGLPPNTPDQERIFKSTEVPGLAYLQVDDPRDDSQFDTDARSDGASYMGDHLSRVPVVAAARVGRVFGVFRPEQDVNFDIFFERRGHWPSWAGAWMYYALLPLAAYALVMMRKRRIPISPPIAMFAMVTITVAIAMGITRYRVSVDVVLVVLGGVAISYFVHQIRRPATARSEAPTPSLET
ncbi:MAG TPA: glycosyltransferase family 39 protein [Acidimicrobiia bacterium]|nr:glycosyltransferase family 39 protein [Acidimicrobiia bacterium]